MKANGFSIAHMPTQDFATAHTFDLCSISIGVNPYKASIYLRLFLAAAAAAPLGALEEKAFKSPSSSSP
jgi:hypothetical protein